MKKRNLLLMLLLAIGLPWVAMAQTVTIGTGTSTHNSAPIANYYNYSLAEMLFTSAEIGTTDANTILSLGFEGSAASSKTYGITVYMKNVDATGFTASTDYIQVSADDIVYTGSIKPEVGWNTIDLANPFAYDNTKSLLVVVNKTSGGYDSSSAIWKYTSTSSSYMMLYAQTDGSSYNPTTLTSLATNAERPNVQLTFGTPPTCFAPQNLTCTEYTATSATLTWQRHASGTENAWVLQYSTDNTFATSVQSVNVSNTPSTQLTGLTAETKYYARVRPDCDENLWSNVCEFKPSATQIVTIGSGTDNNSYLPAYTLYNNSLSEQIYTAAEVGMAGTINSLAFYNGGTTKTPNLKIYLVHTDVTEFSSATAWLTVTATDLVFEGDVELTANQWTTIEFNNEFDYDGSSNLGLIVDEHMTYSSGLSCRVFTSTDNCSMYVYSDGTDYNAVGASYSNGVRAAVKNQIQLGILATNTPKPRNLVVSNITTEGATVTWEAPATGTPTGYEYQYKTSTGEWPAAWTDNGTNLTCTLSELTASTDYVVRVRANYAEGDSDPAEIQFTTEATCLPPTGLHVASLTATSVTIAWDAEEDALYQVYFPGGQPTNPFDPTTPPENSMDDWGWNTQPETESTASWNNCLTPQSHYGVWVRRYCGPNDFSDPISIEFDTPCGAYDIPYVYGFEDAAPFGCWTVISGNITLINTRWRN